MNEEMDEMLRWEKGGKYIITFDDIAEMFPFYKKEILVYVLTELYKKGCIALFDKKPVVKTVLADGISSMDAYDLI